ncbi:MAG: chemotaxis protein CheW, partial [Desulfatiglandales bacterium]
KGEMVLFRDELIPVFRLHKMFDIEGAANDSSEGLLVILQEGERHCALLVDTLLGQQQVVAKPMGVGIGKVDGFSGAAILGDGRVGLIIDPIEILSLARQHVGSGNYRGRAAGNGREEGAEQITAEETTDQPEAKKEGREVKS